MREDLQFRYTRTHKGAPLCVVENFPGLDAEMTAEELREMSRQLQQAADHLAWLSSGKIPAKKKGGKGL